MDPHLLDAAVGVYSVDDYDLWNVMTISREGDHLVAHMIGRPATVLVPIGPNTFVYGTLDDQIVMQATGSGQVSGLVWRRNQWFENQVAGLRAKLSLSEETVGAMRKLLDNSPQERVITDNMICTAKFATRKDTCVGDSGGPLFAEISRGRFIQVGLTSFSEAGCGMAEQGLFGVYTRVAQYVDWIEQTAR